MEDIKKRAESLIKDLDVSTIKEKIEQIETESASPSFWSDRNTASDRMKELSMLQERLTDIDSLNESLASNQYTEVEKLLNKMEKFIYLSGEYDAQSALVSIHSGQGGVEAMDWTQMLYRMYSRFCEKKGWDTEIIDQTIGEEAGLKSITFTVEGSYAYGLLKGEAGVHRLVRLSPFNADSLRQTSFTLVEVIPQIEEVSSVQIKEEDLDWDFYRAGGHGGQNVNKVSTAVRLKHKPSGIVVSAQSERYQGKNREFALKLLLGKLWAIKEEERKKEEAALKGGYKTPGWGNQIRSYVLHPYKMVKDLRTQTETSNTDAVLAGELDLFIDSEVRLTRPKS